MPIGSLPNSERGANMINIFNPEPVIIGGTLSAAGDYLIQPVKQAIKK